ncbi:MAG: hypothetical protein V4496_02680 [Pseudomonadota bacterium]
MHTKVLGSFGLVLSATLIVSCSTESSQSGYYRSSADSNLVASPTAVVYSPANVAIYNANAAHPQSAEDITLIQVDVYNEYGIRRQQAQVNQMLKEQACSLGGNAVVLINNPDKKHCYAQVIQTNSAAPLPSTLAATPELATTPKSPS